MSETSDYSQQMMFEDENEPISSQESEAGLSPSDSPDSRDPAGPQASPVSRSRTRGKGKRKKTKDTFGPISPSSSKSACLQSSLENRLRQRMEGIGSLEYALTSKRWDMKSGPPIYALRASARRSGFLYSMKMGMVFGKRSSSDRPTSGKDSSGLPLAGYPTPNAQQIDGDPEKILKRREELARKYKNNGFGLNLGQFATTQIPLQGWPKTPCASDGEGGTFDILRAIRENLNPKAKLRDWAQMAGRPTPMVNDELGSQYCYGPKKPDGTRQKFMKLPGATLLSSPASTGKRGVLDAAFSRWLQNYPEAWDRQSPGFESWQKWQDSIRQASERQAETEGEG